MSALPESLSLHLLGTPRWAVPGGPATPLSRKDAALLALLALDGETPRDRAAAWLWPEVPIAGARLNLRQRLHKLRHGGAGGLVQGSAALRLGDGVQVDVRRPSIDPDAGSLLGSLDYGDLEAFDDWLQARRRWVLQQQADALATQAAQAEARGEPDRALLLCQRITGLVPTHEQAWRRLMRLHMLRGERAAALAAFDRFEREVCAPQGLQPGAETLELLRSLQRTDAPREAVAPLPACLLRPPRQVGRDEAMRAARAAWSAGRAVLVGGVGGIGKSRLLLELAGDRAGCLSVRARPGDAGAPYASATLLLMQTLEHFAPPLQPPVRAELSRLLPVLGEAPPGEASQPVLWHAVESLLAASLAQGLGTVLVDDLHLADTATLQLLRWLLASPRLEALRWAFAARLDEPGEATAALHDWLGESTRIEPVRLQALSTDQLSELLQTLPLRLLDEAGADFVHDLHRHAGGHPFYTLETLKGLVLDGARGRGLPHPPSVAVLIQRRLARLGPTARALAQLLALAGTALPAAVVERVLQRPHADLAAAWHELEQAQVLQGNAFAHDLVREAVLAELPQGLRPALQERLAQAWQDSGQAAPAPLAAAWAAAGRWAEAGAAWRAAATAARRAGRLGEHRQLLLQAADALDRAGDAAAAFDARCDAVAAQTLLQGDEAALAAAQALEPQAKGSAQRARLALLRAEAWLNRSRADEALQASEQARAEAEPGSPAAVDALGLHGRALALAGHTARAVELLQQAMDDPRTRADPRREAAAAAALAHALAAMGRLAAALAVQRRVVELARAQGDDSELAPQLANQATLELSVGSPERGLPLARDAGERLHTLGADGAQAHFNAVTLARSAAALGDLALAHDTLAALLDGGARIDATIETMARIVLAGVLATLGRPDEAARRLPPPRDDVLPLARAGLLLAHVRVRRAGGRDTADIEQALWALDAERPTLFDEPTLCAEFTRLGPAEAALRRLSRVRRGLRGQGCDGVDRGLALRELQRRLDAGLPLSLHRVRRLQRELPLGLHAGQYRPEAWWILARALAAGGAAAEARACLDQARDWVARARLPDAGPDTRACFERDNPLNRVVLSEAAITPR